MFKRVGILGHPLRPATSDVCSQVAFSLKQRGVDTWCEPSWTPDSVADLVVGSDLIIAIGGDGSMLRAARISSRADVPVFGINAGHLGFLTEAGLQDWDRALDALMSDEYWIEERMMVRAEAWRGETLLTAEDALNDVVVSRGRIAKSILMETYIDGEWATSYNADGLIIATPTGSTAYALAVGGPILPPELKNILVVPVAPHLSLDRPLVLSEGAVVEIVIPESVTTDAVLTIDGETLVEIQAGDAIMVDSSEHISRFVRLRERNYFYRSLLDRMEPRIPLQSSRDGAMRRLKLRKR